MPRAFNSSTSVAAVPAATSAGADPTTTNNNATDHNDAASDDGAASEASSSNPWGRGDREDDDGFVLVTRPLNSIRLVDVWLQREGLSTTNGETATSAPSSGASAHSPHQNSCQQRLSTAAAAAAAVTSDSGDVTTTDDEDDFAQVNVTAIRHRIYHSNGLTSAAAATAPRQQQQQQPRQKKPKRSPEEKMKKKKNANKFRGDECKMEINQQSFLRDMLRAFTARPPTGPLGSAMSLTGTFGAAAVEGGSAALTAGGQDEAAATNAIARYCDNTSAAAAPTTPPPQQNNGSSTGTTAAAPPAITEQQWARIWQQFRNDIGRELFCINGDRYTEAEGAHTALLALFTEFEGAWEQYQTEYFNRDATAARAALLAGTALQQQSHQNGGLFGIGGGGGGLMWNVALAWPASVAMGIVSAPFRLFGRRTPAPSAPQSPHHGHGGAAVSSASYAGASATTAATPPNPATPLGSTPPANASSSPLSSATIAAARGPSALAEGLSRFVVLMSQQSVLAFPYELLHHQFSTGLEDVYVGEIRTFTLGSDDDENASDAIGALSEAEREALEMASSMRVDVRFVPMTTTTTVVPMGETNVERAPTPVPVPTATSSTDGCPSSAAPPAGPIPDPRNVPAARFDGAAAANPSTHQPQLETRRTVVTAPRVELTVKKEFRVFAIKDTDDHTLFHIEAELSLSVTTADEPVSLSWRLKPAPARRDRARESQLVGRGLAAEQSAARGPMPSYAYNAVPPTNTAVVGPVPAVVPVLHASSASASSSSSTPPPASSPAGEGADIPSDCRRLYEAQRRLPRHCGCLGASGGYHRRDCEIAGVAVRGGAAERRQ